MNRTWFSTLIVAGIVCVFPAVLGATDDERLPTEGLVRIDDMLVEQEAVEWETGEVSAMGAIKLTAQRWEDGVLPVHFTDGTKPEQKALFFEACAEWSRVANVRCIEGRYKGRSLTVMHMKLGCFSLYGMGFNFFIARRLMNLENDGCWHKSTILHELGHAFGLVHEHQRPDRDNYVNILRQNAEPGVFGLNIVANFWTIGARPITAYDFLSIMHYAKDAFSKNGKPTILPKPQYSAFTDLMGKQDELSPGDAATMSSLYGLPPHPAREEFSIQPGDQG